MFRFPLIFAFIFSLNVFGSEQISRTIISEYKTLRAFVENLEPDYIVAGYYNAKRYGSHELFWRLGKDGNDGDSIRIYREEDHTGKSFSIDYFTGTHIIRGQKVLRRFVGIEQMGWRNHTIDLNDGFYYGSQGLGSPQITEVDQKIIEKWDVTAFPRK